MFRKFAIAAAAIAALGTVSLSASTPAAAWGKGGGFITSTATTSTAAGFASTRATTPACATVGS